MHWRWSLFRLSSADEIHREKKKRMYYITDELPGTIIRSKLISDAMKPYD